MQVRPCNDEDSLQQVDNIPFNELRDEFKTAIIDLRCLIFDHLVPKTVLGGKSLNGKILLLLPLLLTHTHYFYLLSISIQYIICSYDLMLYINIYS